MGTVGAKSGKQADSKDERPDGRKDVCIKQRPVADDGAKGRASHVDVVLDFGGGGGAEAKGTGAEAKGAKGGGGKAGYVLGEKTVDQAAVKDVPSAAAGRLGIPSEQKPDKKQAS